MVRLKTSERLLRICPTLLLPFISTTLVSLFLGIVAFWALSLQTGHVCQVQLYGSPYSILVVSYLYRDCGKRHLTNPVGYHDILDMLSGQ